jgi:hypothetical protein
MTPRRTWPWWALAFAVGIALWIAIYDLLGAFVALGILAFGVCALAYAGEWLHAQPTPIIRKDD